ncbi:MAG: AbrB/MazE/SpoVT family DNA-binding domain-containing protein [Thaumarchaeota archaeon]|nr:AbrB/MazE/SpoVT family DNA-binding domain-containing protein [Nitrososphaerota archaeon]
MSLVRVKRKGQVTLPVEIRRKMKIDEGSMLEVKQDADAILLKVAPRIEAGKVVGEKVYKEIIAELDDARRRWR